MKEIEILKEAAVKLGSNSLVDELNALEGRLEQKDAPVLIPLVGEFSSGKTSLINALTDSKALETATKPTTATIFEIHFGADVNRAEVVNSNGEVHEVTDISRLKNDSLSDATVVTVFDTSKRVSPYTILVDTPGISSPNPKHQQVLVDFLPQADALMVVVDINQQLTKSLQTFLKSACLSGVEVDVVLTKSDTKSESAILSAKKYLTENCEIPIRNLVAVSASSGKLDEIYSLLHDIEVRKGDILKKSIGKRLKSISEQILNSIDTLLNAAEDTSSLQTEISEQKHRLQKVQRRIDQFIRDIGGEIEEITRDASRKFEDQVSSRLNSIINGKSQNYDSEAVSAINTIASAIVGDYRQKIMRLLADKANGSSNNEISLSAFTGVDLSSVGIQGLSYDLNLDGLGHEYDGWIKSGVIAVGAIAAVAAVATTGGAAAVAGAVDGASTVGTVIDVADTVTDVGSMVSNRKMVGRMEQAVKYGQQAADKYTAIDNINNNGIGGGGSGKGMLDSLAGFIAEKTMSKPQRARAIRMYIDDSLAPEFKNQLHNAETNVLETTKSVLMESAKATIDELTSQLKTLETQMRDDTSAANDRRTELRELKTKILTL